MIRRQEKHEIKLPLSCARERMGCLQLWPRNIPAGGTRVSPQDRFLITAGERPGARTVRWPHRRGTDTSGPNLGNHQLGVPKEGAMGKR